MTTMMTGRMERRMAEIADDLKAANDGYIDRAEIAAQALAAVSPADLAELWSEWGVGLEELEAHVDFCEWELADLADEDIAVEIALAEVGTYGATLESGLAHRPDIRGRVLVIHAMLCEVGEVVRQARVFQRLAASGWSDEDEAMLRSFSSLLAYRDDARDTWVEFRVLRGEMEEIEVDGTHGWCWVPDEIGDAYGYEDRADAQEVYDLLDPTAIFYARRAAEVDRGDGLSLDRRACVELVAVVRGWDDHGEVVDLSTDMLLSKTFDVRNDDAAKALLRHILGA